MLCNNKWKSGFIIILFLFFIYFLFDNISPVNKILNKMHLNKEEYFSANFSDKSFKTVETKALAQLMNPGLKLKNRSDDSSNLENLVKSLVIKNDYNNWDSSLMLLGLLESNPSVNLKFVENFCSKIIDNQGNFKYKLQKADQCMVGYIFLELYSITHKHKYKAAADKLAGFLIKDYPKSISGTVPYRIKYQNYMFIDTIGMISPFLIRYGETFHNPNATNLGVKQLKEFLNTAIDKKTGLPYHAYDAQTQQTFGILGWLRGIGWLSIGLADSLKYLSHENEDYQYLTKQFNSLITNVSRYQNKENPWNWDIENSYGHIDTSGTAMIGYSIEKGISEKVLDKKFQNVSENAMLGILKSVNKDGSVENSLTECQGIGHYPNKFGSSNYTQGTTLALYSLIMYRKNDLAGINNAKK
ncbi:MAG: glycoside hydrolase family 88 protein [Candidatus Gastranaerophilales bacterium]|nr:glycoside hydrolase family 88 protein [Candidatus Gastranaerophilales bacterium]